MKIFKDILGSLQIETVYILCNGILHLCIPLEISGISWFVACDSDGLSGSVKLKVKYRGSFLYLDAVIVRKKTENLYSFTYEVLIAAGEQNSDRFKRSFFLNIREMEEQCEKWNKRAEERYDIGLDGKRLEYMRFKNPEQLLVAEKIQLPCVVNNLSYSGAKITTMEGNFARDRKVCLNLSFVRPIEQIPVVGCIINCTIKTTRDSQVVSILSIRFENAPLEYKKRLDAFISAITMENR